MEYILHKLASYISKLFLKKKGNEENEEEKKQNRGKYKAVNETINQITVRPAPFSKPTPLVHLTRDPLRHKLVVWMITSNILVKTHWITRDTFNNNNKLCI